MIEIIIPGKCQAKQRARRGRGGKFYTPKETVNYEKEIKWHAKLSMKGKKPLERYLKAEILVGCQIPASYSKGERTACLDGRRYPTGKDLDNLCKAILDGLNGISYLDDRQVVILNARKEYRDEPFVMVKLIEIAEDGREI